MLNGVKWRFDLRAPYNKQRRKYMIRTDLIELVVIFYNYMYICINYYDLVIFKIMTKSRAAYSIINREVYNKKQMLYIYNY